VLLGTAVSALLAQPAFAQTGDSADDAARGDIVVTAQKREQRLVDVPASVSVISGQTLAESHAKDLIDASSLTPGVVVSPQAFGGRTMQTFTIRGIGFDDFRPNGSPSAAVNIDGVYQGSSALVGGQMFDVDRIEILKGPQGTLYGRNTTAGAVNIISRQPTDAWHGNIRADYGEYDSRRIEGGIGGPLSSTLSFRVAGIYDHTDGYVTNLGSGAAATVTPAAGIPPVGDPGRDDEAGRSTFYGGRGILKYDSGSGTVLTLNAHGFREKGAMQQLERLAPLGGYSANAPFTVDSNVVPSLSKKSYGGSLTLNQDVSDDIALIAVGGYENAEQDYTSNGEFLPTRRGDTYYSDQLHQWSAEVRLQNRAPAPVEWVLGATAFTNKVGIASLLDLSDAVRSKLSTDYTQKSRSFGIFGDGTVHITPKLKLGAGLRYSNDHSSFDGATIDLNPYGMSIGAVAFPNVPVSFDRDFDDSDISGRANLSYEPAAGSTIYASISRGYKAGGFDGSTILSVPESDPFKSETVWTYEVGAKFLPRSSPVQLEASAFYNDFSDLQASATRIAGGLPTSIRTNVGKARTYGAEVSVVARPISGLEMQVGVQWLNSKITGVVSDNAAERERRIGNELPFAPKLTLTGAVRYKIPLANGASLTPSVNGRFIDDYYSELDNYRAIPGYFRGDAQVELALSNGLTIAGWVRNFTDVRYLATLYATNTTFAGFRGAPRTFGGSVGFRF